MILRLIFALAFILTGAELAAIDTAVAAGSGFGIQLSINGPKEPNTDRPGGDIRNFEIFGTIGGLGVAEDTCQSACVQNSPAARGRW